MRRQSKCLSAQSGMSLIEVILGAAVVAIAAVAIPQVMKLIQHSSAQSQAIRVSVTERTKIEALLKNHAAWAQTMQNNPSFACGINGTGCSENFSNNGFYNFVLYGSEPNEKLTYDPNDSTTRVTLQGAHCPAGTPDPSERCPIQFQAAWKPVCAAYPCVNPTLQIKISLSTKYGPASDDVIPINVEKYGHSVVRNFNEDDIQSACLVLNGTYNSVTNTCLPPHAGRDCASLGKPAQVVTGVDSSGNITCSPFYHNTCNPATEMMTGVSATGAAICSPRPPLPPDIDCVGNWGACSAACNGGTQTYSITTPASGGGVACPFANGATQACNSGPCSVNCVGAWQACTQLCGGGTSTFMVTTPAANGGSACIANHGDTMACNTQACGVPVDCAGTWSACDPVAGTQTFTMTQAAQNGGVACPASPRTCAVDCVGDWGACSGSPSSKTYSWSVTPKNGGNSCTYANGVTDATGCTVTVPDWDGLKVHCKAKAFGGTYSDEETRPFKSGKTLHCEPGCSYGGASVNNCKDYTDKDAVFKYDVSVSSDYRVDWSGDCAGTIGNACSLSRHGNSVTVSGAFTIVHLPSGEQQTMNFYGYYEPGSGK